MASYTTRIVLLLLLVAVFMQPVHALTGDWEDQLTANAITSIGAVEKHGQSITIPAHGGNDYNDAVTSILLNITKVGTPNDLTIRLYEFDGSSVGAEITSWTYSESSVAPSCEWKTIVSTGANFPTYSNTTYLFSVEGTIDASNKYQVCDRFGSDLYTDGDKWSYNGTEWNKHATGVDLTFQFYYDYNNPVFSVSPAEIYPIDDATGIPLDITVNWSAGTDTDGDTPLWYKVAATFPDSSYQTGLTYAPPTLTDNTTYTWEVRYQDDWCHDKGDICGYGVTAESFTTLTLAADEAPITNLTVIGYSDEYITWNWTNPTYDEFNHTEIYKNGGWVDNITTPDNEVSFLNLDSNTNYTISTRTVDDDGNINETWVNDTQKTLFACGDAQDEICSLGLNLTVPNYNVLSFVNGSFPTTAWGNTFNLTGVVAPLTIDYIRMGVYDGAELGCKDASSITISIATIVGGEPDTVLASEETTCDNIPDSALEYYPFFTDGLSISPDTEYGFYINMSNGTGLDALFVLKNPNNYAYGQHIFANATSVWGTNASWDASFILGYTASSVPPAGRNESYVKWNGSNSNDGSSWTYAWDAIGFAIGNTFSHTNSTIHIGMGNYSADPEITVGTLAMFWADTSGPMQNTSEVWVDMPSVNISS